MNQNDAEAMFFEKDVLPLHILYKNKMTESLAKEPKRITDAVSACLIKARDMTEAAGLDAGFLVFTLLRTELLENRGRFLIRVYDKSWYYGESMDLFWLDAEGVYQYFFRFWEEAKQKSRRFMGKVTEAAVQNMALDLVMEYHTVIAELLNFDDSWQKCWPEAEIYIGEYMGSLKRLGKEETDGILLGGDGPQDNEWNS